MMAFSGHAYVIDTTVLLVFFFVASFLIFGYRLLVKQLYRISITEDNTVNVIVYGVELNSSLVKMSVENLSDSAYRVVAFIEDEEQYITKTIDGIEIYSYTETEEIIRRFNAKAVFFAKDKMDADLKRNIVDVCLSHHMQVMNIPSVADWINSNQKLSRLEQVKIEELLGRPSISLPNEHVINMLGTKSILITGAAGSIGSELARQVAAICPASLIICDKSETGLFELEYELQQKYKLGASLKVFLGDVKDEYAMNRLFAAYMPNIVFHAAAFKHVPMMESHPSEAILTNVQGTRVLADLAELYDVERFLFVSTDKAINPTNVMGASKRIAEMYCHALHGKADCQPKELPVLPMLPSVKLKSKTKFITTRFGNVLGSNGSVIPRFQQQIAAGGPVTVTHPEIIRYFMTIHEACSLVLEAVTIGNGGELYLFDMGEPVKILDLAKKMIRLAGKEPGSEINIEFTGLRPGEKLYEELLNKAEEVIPTHNKKILVAKVIECDYQGLIAGINELIETAQVCNDKKVVSHIRQLVPEYKSSNAVFDLNNKEIDPARIASNAF
ncbi:polysaccharide biosynthesis protein [Foetidibacter luteolus]|uniref:polysaccharide biosynthesis protein n=1 Tax=Foetidibacter luteolus TaxID=2608880 RepID=UPI001A98132D|nr:nucleoside-diphosphate sugar epimerase/dehydratase [Foetidibacter luteolus]